MVVFDVLTNLLDPSCVAVYVGCISFFVAHDVSADPADDGLVLGVSSSENTLSGDSLLILEEFSKVNKFDWALESVSSIAGWTSGWLAGHSFEYGGDAA